MAGEARSGGREVATNERQWLVAVWIVPLLFLYFLALLCLLRRATRARCPTHRVAIRQEGLVEYSNCGVGAAQAFLVEHAHGGAAHRDGAPGGFVEFSLGDAQLSGFLEMCVEAGMTPAMQNQAEQD